LGVLRPSLGVSHPSLGVPRPSLGVLRRSLGVLRPSLGRSGKSADFRRGKGRPSADDGDRLRGEEPGTGGRLDRTAGLRDRSMAERLRYAEIEGAPHIMHPAE
jgi:hypothetical protein